ncbi:hypothetical protein LZ575_15535 [Antarcticibacterium sp. 1MA-6-2]|uniref:hypothetical protein n=1 Tax=Antarcticibacterium sp. 1MA-6-2 TaxID=2908210 RepID=UPI001F41CB1C|nr:hypothetical protein [Antarcticibacterium sp. 1MA-6-2]UJH90266.1 hypothetical protein LZ575_15535 [Antarcticibacterium sp. 1MA-6-2]
MKKNFALLFLFIFLGFIATPTVVTLIDKDVNISSAFTANEEENSSKTGITFEYNIQDPHPGYSSLHFLKEQSAFNHYYKEGYRLIFLDVLSPPPKQA